VTDKRRLNIHQEEKKKACISERKKKSSIIWVTGGRLGNDHYRDVLFSVGTTAVTNGTIKSPWQWCIRWLIMN